MVGSSAPRAGQTGSERIISISSVRTSRPKPASHSARLRQVSLPASGSSLTASTVCWNSSRSQPFSFVLCSMISSFLLRSLQHLRHQLGYAPPETLTSFPAYLLLTVKLAANPYGFLTEPPEQVAVERLADIRKLMPHRLKPPFSRQRTWLVSR